jgi:large conductance mechanosensitive channel
MRKMLADAVGIFPDLAQARRIAFSIYAYETSTGSQEDSGKLPIKKLYFSSNRRYRLQTRRPGGPTLACVCNETKKGAAMLKEFKDFAMKGNVVDLAVGVIIGGAFGKIVESMVADIIMPIIGAIFGNVDFSNLYASLGAKVTAGMGYADAKKAGAVLGYGQFLTYVVNFLIVAFVLFLVIKAMNTMKKAEAAAPAAPTPPTASESLLGEIRDLLKK